MTAQTILIMAGGTGGHVFPGLAVAHYLKEAGWHIVWLGTKTGMESALVQKHGYDVETINFSGLRGKSTAAWLTLPLRLLLAFWQSAKVIFNVRPDVVLGMGGYPAFPGGMMAVLLNKPLIIHEQNSIPGLTNKVLAKLADKVLLAFPGAIQGPVNKILTVGNPVRNEICQVESPEKRFEGRNGKLKLLVVGGSRGAQVFNTVVPQALKLIPENMRPLVTHQAGGNHLNKLRKNYKELGVEAELVEFIDNISSNYTACDLVLCRAGALTIAELTAAGVASVLVPFPHAVDDHQTSNAKFLSENHAALLLPQEKLNPQSLKELLLNITREKLLAIAKAARALAKPDATSLVAQVCMDINGLAR